MLLLLTLIGILLTLASGALIAGFTYKYFEDVTGTDWPIVKFQDIRAYYEKYPERMDLYFSHVEISSNYGNLHHTVDSTFRFGYFDAIKCELYLLTEQWREIHRNERADEILAELKEYDEQHKNDNKGE